MKQKFVLGLFIIILLLIFSIKLNFWERRPVSCTQADDAILRSLNFAETDVRELLTWIKENHQIDKSDVYIGDLAEDLVFLRWNYQGSDYYAYFRNDSLVNIFVYWDKLQPIGKEMLNCFSQPDLYYAQYGIAPHGYALILDLWYLEKGLVIGATHFSQDQQPPIIDENIIMTDIRLLPPGSAEEFYARMSLEGWGDYPVDVLKPWPGSWEEIVIDNKLVIE